MQTRHPFKKRIRKCHLDKSILKIAETFANLAEIFTKFQLTTISDYSGNMHYMNYDVLIISLKLVMILLAESLRKTMKKVPNVTIIKKIVKLSIGCSQNLQTLFHYKLINS